MKSVFTNFVSGWESRSILHCVSIYPKIREFARVLSITVLGIVFLSACTLRIGGDTKLSDAPAPTAMPLVESQPAEALPNPNELPRPEHPISLPPGFSISVFAQGLDRPRMMALGPDGIVYIAERGANRIVRIPDQNGDGMGDNIQVVANSLNNPSSLAFHPDGSLYIGETTRILRLSAADEMGVFQNQETIIDGLPSGGHNTRTVLFSPDGETLFISVGSSCNICDEDDPRRATIVRYNPDGSGEEIYARGLRNAVGIVFRPGTDELWATNNGRDMLGDDLPPETIYRVQAGGDYGWPYCHSGRIIDPDMGNPTSCEGVLPPDVEMQAHSAPLGLRFYDGALFPDEYQGDLFVAFHGSWNRSDPTGYKVIRIPVGADGAPGPVQDFAAGWLRGNSSWGRPVDILVAADGSLLISDDGGGMIYRITYSPTS